MLPCVICGEDHACPTPANDDAAAWARSTARPDACGGFENDEPAPYEDCRAEDPEAPLCGECLGCVAHAYAEASLGEEPATRVALAADHRAADLRAAEAEDYDAMLAVEGGAA